MELNNRINYLKKSLPQDRYEELDALRGLAALMVVLFHFTIGRAEANLGFKLGSTGVDLFFIISGFVIFMSLTKAKKSLDFIINRFSRLYPTYWACVTFTFIFILVSSHLIYKNSILDKNHFMQYLGNMTMFQYYLKIPDIDGPYWTMIIEINFYIVILFLFHFKILRYLNSIGITLSILVVMITSFGGELLVKKILWWVPLLQFIPMFFAGIIFYTIYTYKKNLLQNYIILLICLACQILLYNYAGTSHNFIKHSEYAIMLITYFSLFVLFVNHKLKFIISRPTLFLGKISFALYLVHQYISIGFIIPFFADELQINFWIVSLLITLPIVILLASFITYYIEIPMSKIIKEKLRLLLT